MAGLKYSKQRASIKDYLMHTTSHPTADTVYLHIKEEFPNISLGTVYRNLNLLADIGEALRIPTPDGGDRFDGRCEPHYHVVCTNCGMYSIWKWRIPISRRLMKMRINVSMESSNHTLHFSTVSVPNVPKN